LRCFAYYQMPMLDSIDNIRWIAFLCGVVVCMLAAGRAPGAGTCPEMSGADPALAARDADERLDFIRERLAGEASRGRIWNDAWSISYGLLTATQLVLVPVFEDTGTRADLYVGAGSSAVGLLALVILPLEVMSDSSELGRQLSEQGDQPDRCAVLERAESLLQSAAESEQLGVSFWMHAASALVNIGAGLILGLGFDRWESGAINAAAGIAIGELMILTQPSRLPGELQRYRSGEFESGGEQTVSWALLPGFSRSGGGLSFVLSF